MLTPFNEPGPSPATNGGSITELLHAWHGGSEAARNRVFELTYTELRAIAGAYLRRERRLPSMQVTSLVHEAFLRLLGTRAPWEDRAHFYGVAAQAMRRILVDHARRRQALKRSPEEFKIGFPADADNQDRAGWAALKLNDALTELEKMDPRQGRVVELRYFGGLTIEETAAALEISPATVKREWATARAWMARRIHNTGEIP